MNRKTKSALGTKNYWLFSRDGQINDGIDKKLKKMSNRLIRHRLKHALRAPIPELDSGENKS